MAQSLKQVLLALALLSLAWAQPSISVDYVQERLLPEEERGFQGGLQWMLDFFQSQGFTPVPHLQARIFASFDEFRGYQMSHRSFRAGDSPSRTAYYSIGLKELVTWRNQGLVPLLIHESQHALLRSFFPRPPKWLNEGLSEVFEGLDTQSEPPVLMPQRGRLRKVKRLLTLPGFVEHVAQVVKLSERDYNQRANLRDFDSYTCSWALIYYLWCLPDGPDLVAELIRSQQRGQDIETVLAQLAPDWQSEILPFYESLR